MNDNMHNPLGLDGFAFVEFTGPDTADMARQLEMLGFTAFARHPELDVTLFRQGRIAFVLNHDATEQARGFAAAHGPSANGMAFKVANAGKAYELALASGAKPAGGGLLTQYVLEGI
ncbi:MAG: 4-hydroxyphenylpyruvate dioxygenase, partial [Asticcacaulis sp.]|nr:4-hydroxyphenylpyruvate dioxygenase [Asticcacaulis sp.]